MRTAIADARVPAWVHRVGAAAWVTSTDQRLLGLNWRAERLFGTSADRCVGCPCHEVVASRDPSGEPFCCADCVVTRRTLQGREILPFRVSLPVPCGDAVPAWVLAIPERSPGDGEAVVVHCALLDDRAAWVEHRFCPIEILVQFPTGGPLARLSPRERDVLRALVAHGSLSVVSDRLGIARTTVRNHVQHILAKLEVHSMRDAVVRFMTEDGTARIDIEDGGEARRPAGSASPGSSP